MSPIISSSLNVAPAEGAWTHLLLQELLAGLVEGAGFVGHEQILFLKRVQVLQSIADVFQNSIALLLVAVQIISGFPGEKTHTFSQRRDHAAETGDLVCRVVWQHRAGDFIRCCVQAWHSSDWPLNSCAPPAVRGRTAAVTLLIGVCSKVQLQPWGSRFLPRFCYCGLSPWNRALAWDLSKTRIKWVTLVL